MLIKENYSLLEHNTFGIKSECKYFLNVYNIEDIKASLDFISQKNLKYFILGGGSNILFTENTNNLAIIKPEIKNIIINNNTVIVGSSVNLQYLIQESFKNNLTGLEWAAGIPGTIGGAIFGNSGSFNGDMCSIINNVKVFNTHTREIEILSNKECNFSYRNSIFKINPNKYIIIETTLKLDKVSKNELENAKNIFKENITKKINTQPVNEKSAGCIFKNIIFNKNNKILEKLILDNNYPIKDNTIATAFIIDKLGLKGMNSGDAQISNKHANFIVNINNATSDNIINLISKIEKEVLEKLNISLEKEIEII